MFIRMSEGRLVLEHKRLISKFYEGAIKRHTNGAQLAGKLRSLLERLDQAQEKNEEDLPYLQTLQPRKSRDESPINEMQSLRITNSSSKNALEVSRSKASRRSDSSRERSEGDNRFFGVDWVYSSPDQSRVYVFALLASFILTDNTVGFFKLEDRVNEELDRSKSIPPILMLAINKYWQRIIEILTKKKSYLWEKHLKEPISNMPLDFNKLIARLIAGTDLNGGPFTQDQAGRLAKEGKLAIVNFTLNFREIEGVQREGSPPNEIIMGYIRHRNTYVIANKIPEYNESELAHRKARSFLQQGLRLLLA